MRFLLAILIILCPLAFSAETTAIPQVDGSLVITLPREVVEQCEAQGGCRIMSKEQLIEFIRAIKPKLCNEVGV